MTTKEGDWQNASDLRAAQCSEEVTASEEDVIQAFRWILGREISDPSELHRHLEETNRDRRALRLRLLRSPEFSRQLDSFGLYPATFIESLSSCSVRDKRHREEKTFVFIHIPKAGGTSLHYHLLQGFNGSDVCPKRHNDLLLSPLEFLKSYTLFSGHYDIRIVDTIPTKDTMAFTMLREPKSRLISMYNYLASHRPARVNSMDFMLAQAARSNDFEGFLTAALKINPAAVDNTYARAFGSALPISRWETAAEKTWMIRFAAMNESDWSETVSRAEQRLASLDAVGFVETFDESCSSIMRLAGIEPPEKIERLKDIDRITEETIGFEPVRKPRIGQSALLDRLTRFDDYLYRLFRKR